MDDQGIIALYWARDERAIAETAAKYGPYCFSIASGILESRDDAEEAVSDTYMGAWNAIPPHRPERLSTFLGKIARRAALKKRKENRAAKRGGGETALALEELGECIPSSTSVERELEMAELSRLLDRFVMALPEVERRVFLRRYWYLEPIAAIAKDLGFSGSKVKSMLHRTRNKLRTFLEKEGITL